MTAEKEEDSSMVPKKPAFAIGKLGFVGFFCELFPKSTKINFNLVSKMMIMTGVELMRFFYYMILR